MSRLGVVLVALAVAASAAGCGRSSGRTSGSRAAPTSIAAGRTVFNTAGCSSCHTLAAAHATGNIGPDLDVRLRPSCATLLATKLHGETLSECIETLIVHPYRFIPSGYFAGVMPADFGKALSHDQLTAVVHFLAADAR